MISCISLESPSHAEKNGDGMKLLAPRMSKLWLFLGRDVRTKQKGTTFYVFIASSRQLVLSDGLTIDAIGNGISQINVAVSRSL